MRKLIREETFGFPEIDMEGRWRCTTCGKCLQQCLRDIRQVDDVVALRRLFSCCYVSYDQRLKKEGSPGNGCHFAESGCGLWHTGGHGGQGELL